MNKIKEEVWKEVPGYEGRYQVSNRGEIKSLDRKNSRGTRLKERLLKQNPAGGGYLRVNLCKESKVKGFQVHQLVAMAFLNHIPCGYKLVVDHIDGNKLNNHLDNLQVITNRENTSKDRRGGSSRYVGVCFRKDTKKWKAQIQINGKIKNLGSFTNELEAGEAYQNKLKEIQK